jgi:hypothetical protein
MTTKCVGVARILIVAVMAGAAFVACGGEQRPTAPTAPEPRAVQGSTSSPSRLADTTTGTDSTVGGGGETTDITPRFTTQAIPGPVPDDAMVRWAGLDWVWASPCSGGCAEEPPVAAQPSAQPGFRYATAVEFANKPTFICS